MMLIFLLSGMTLIPCLTGKEAGGRDELPTIPAIGPGRGGLLTSKRVAAGRRRRVVASNN